MDDIHKELIIYLVGAVLIAAILFTAIVVDNHNIHQAKIRILELTLEAAKLENQG